VYRSRHAQFLVDRIALWCVDLVRVSRTSARIQLGGDYVNLCSIVVAR
jgi:hypothetical protein